MKVNLDPKGIKQLEEYISNLEKENQQLKDRINKAGDLLKLLHYQFPDYDDIHNRIEDIEKNTEKTMNHLPS